MKPSRDTFRAPNKPSWIAASDAAHWASTEFNRPNWEGLFPVESADGRRSGLLVRNLDTQQFALYVAGSFQSFPQREGRRLVEKRG